MHPIPLSPARPRFLVALATVALALAPSAHAQIAPSLAVSPGSGNVGQPFTATYSNGSYKEMLTLNWGDGTTEKVPVGNGARSHAYTTPGPRTVTLLRGTQVADSRTIQVVAVAGCTLTVSPASPRPGETVSFVVTFTGGAGPFRLEFGDGASANLVPGASNKAGASHAYDSPGVYPATVVDAQDGRPVCTATINVKIPAVTLAVAPTDPAPNQDVTATMGHLTAGVAYTLDWGDGATQTVTGSGTSTAKHPFAQPGVYVVRLSAEGMAPATATVTVKAPAMTLAVTPNPANVGQDVTATMGHLTAGVTYTLDWGDGATQTVTGNGTATAKHPFAQPGVYVVRLSAEGMAPATATVNVKAPNMTLALTPNPASIGEGVTAAMGSLAPGVTYTLDWGDGATQTVTGNGTATAKHPFAQPGVYVVRLSADGLPPATATVTVKAPNMTLALTPNPAKVNEGVTATMGSLAPGVTYTLDWGDGATQTVTGNGTLTAKHPFAQPGVYVVRLSADGLPPATATVRVTPGLTARSLRLRFTRPENRTSPVVTPGSRVDAALELEYEGSGVLRGQVLVDGKPFAGVALNAPASGRRAVLALNNLPAVQLGAHTLTYVPETEPGEVPVPATPGALTYLVREAPEILEIGGFEFRVTKTTDLDYDDFGGEAKHTLVVGGVEAFQDVEVSFRDLKVEEVGEKRVRVLAGTIEMDLSKFDRTPLPAGVTSFGLKSDGVRFTPQGASFEGQVALRWRCGEQKDTPAPSLEGVRAALGSGPASGRQVVATAALASPSQNIGASEDFRFGPLRNRAKLASAMRGLGDVFECENRRPDPAASFAVKGDLAPVTGDLYATAKKALADLKQPGSPLTVGGTVDVTLDLSASRSNGREADVQPLYALRPEVEAPPVGNAWMGVVLENARVKLGTATLPGTTATLRTGWTYGGEIGGGTYQDRGWTFKLARLLVASVNSQLVQVEGEATARVPLFHQDAKVTIDTTEENVEYTLAEPLERDFGSSTLTAGGGAWTEEDGKLQLRLSGTSWDLRTLSAMRTIGIKRGALHSKGFSLAASTATNAAVAARSEEIAQAALSASAPGAVSSSSGTTQQAVEALLKVSGVLQIEDGAAPLGTIALHADGGVNFVYTSRLARRNGVENAAGTSADGLSTRPLTAPDFKMLGQVFNVQRAVIGRDGDEYVLGLDGRQQLSSEVQSVGTAMRYRTRNGLDLEVLVRTDGFSREVNPDARFEVQGSEVRKALRASALGRQYDAVANRAGGSTDAPTSSSTKKAELREVPGGYELVLNGNIETGKGASKMRVDAEALFGLTDDPYFYVKAGVEKRTPIVSLLALNIYGFTGGVAYNMAWPDNAEVSDYARPPVKTGDRRLQIVGGLSGAFEDGNSMHFKSVFKIDTQRGFELAADAWLLTKMDEGLFGTKKPKALLHANVTADGFDMWGCLGPYPGLEFDGQKLNCERLDRFVVADVVEIKGWMKAQFNGEAKYVKVGTYTKPVEVTADIPVLGKVPAKVFVILGDAKEPGDRKENRTGSGLFMGLKVEANYRAAGAWDSTLPVFECYPWARATAHGLLDIEAGLLFSPIGLEVDADLDLDFSLRGGCAGRDRPFKNKDEIFAWTGKSIGVEIDAHVDGYFKAFNPVTFNGNASLKVDMDWFPTFSVSTSVSF